MFSLVWIRSRHMTWAPRIITRYIRYPNHDEKCLSSLISFSLPSSSQLYSVFTLTAVTCTVVWTTSFVSSGASVRTRVGCGFGLFKLAKYDITHEYSVHILFLLFFSYILVRHVLTSHFYHWTCWWLDCLITFCALQLSSQHIDKEDTFIEPGGTKGNSLKIHCITHNHNTVTC